MADEQYALVPGGAPGLNRPGGSNANIRYNGFNSAGREVTINFSGPITDTIARHAFEAGTGHTHAIQTAVTNALLMVWGIVVRARGTVSEQLLLWLYQVIQAPIHYPGGVDMPLMPVPVEAGENAAQLAEVQARLQASEASNATLTTQLAAAEASNATSKTQIAALEMTIAALTTALGATTKVPVATTKVPVAGGAKKEPESDDETNGAASRRGKRGRGGK